MQRVRAANPVKANPSFCGHNCRYKCSGGPGAQICGCVCRPSTSRTDQYGDVVTQPEIFIDAASVTTPKPRRSAPWYRPGKGRATRAYPVRVQLRRGGRRANPGWVPWVAGGFALVALGAVVHRCREGVIYESTDAASVMGQQASASKRIDAMGCFAAPRYTAHLTLTVGGQQMIDASRGFDSLADAKAWLGDPLADGDLEAALNGTEQNPRRARRGRTVRMTSVPPVRAWGRR